VIIRKTTIHDLEEILSIYSYARQFMRDSGNPDQWKDDHPAREMVVSDIEAGLSYVCLLDDEITAVFYFSIETEPTYGKIAGKWQNGEPYGVVHRIARSQSAQGAGAYCLDWCLEQCRNLRIDTHRDNSPMRRLLYKQGFAYCGTIWLENGEERLAYQKVAEVQLQ